MNISNLLTAFTLSRGEQAQEVLVPVAPGAEFEAGLAMPETALPLAIATPPLPKAAALDALMAQAEVAAQDVKDALPVSWHATAPDQVERADVSVQPPLQPDDPVTFDAAMAYGLFSLPLATAEAKPSDATGGAVAVSAAQGPKETPHLQQANPLAERVVPLGVATGMQDAVWPVGIKQLDLEGERSAPLAQTDQAVLTGQMVESAEQTSALLAAGAAEDQGGNQKARAETSISQAPSGDRLERKQSPSVRSLEQGQTVQAPGAAVHGALPQLAAANTDVPQRLGGVKGGVGLAPQATSVIAKGDRPRIAAITADAPNGLDRVVAGSGRIVQSPSAVAKGDGPRPDAVSKDAPQRLGGVASDLGLASQARSAVANRDAKRAEPVSKAASQGVQGVASGLGWAIQGATVSAQGGVLSLEAVDIDAPQGLGAVPIELVLVSQATGGAAKADVPRHEAVNQDAGQGVDVEAAADGAVVTGAVAKAASAVREAPNLGDFNAASSSMDALPLLAALATPVSSQGPIPARQTISRLGIQAGSGQIMPNLGVATRARVEPNALGPAQGDSHLGLTASPPERPIKGAFDPADMIGAPNSALDSAEFVTRGGLNVAPPLAPDNASASVPRAALTLHANMPAVIAHLHQSPVREGHSQAELLMNPAELGRIRFDLITQGDQVQVTLSVERPETLDLLRANAEALRQEFRTAGLNADTLNFGQWAQRPPAREQAQVLLEHATPSLQLPALPVPYIKPVSAHGLDLRL